MDPEKAGDMEVTQRLGKTGGLRRPPPSKSKHLKMLMKANNYLRLQRMCQQWPVTIKSSYSTPAKCHGFMHLFQQSTCLQRAFTTRFLQTLTLPTRDWEVVFSAEFGQANTSRDGLKKPPLLIQPWRTALSQVWEEAGIKISHRTAGSRYHCPHFCWHLDFTDSIWRLFFQSSFQD